MAVQAEVLRCALHASTGKEKQPILSNLLLICPSIRIRSGMDDKEQPHKDEEQQARRRRATLSFDLGVNTHHNPGVGSDDHIVDATHKGKSQLYANSHRKKGAIDASLNCKEEIEAAHLFWIG